MTTEPSNTSGASDQSKKELSSFGALPSDTASVEERPHARPALGEEFKRRRLALNLSTLEVSEQIKWSVKQIEALESNQWNALPKTTILKGFLRAYARLLNFDPEPVLHALQLDTQTPEAAMPPAHISGDDAPRRLSASHANDYGLGRAWPLSRVLKIILLIVVVVVIASKLAPAVLRWFETPTPVASQQPERQLSSTRSASSVAIEPKDNADRPVLAAAPALMPAQVNQKAQQALASSAPTTTPPVLSLSSGVSIPPTALAAQPTAHPSAAKLKVMFHGDAWIEVRDAQGRVLLSERGNPGSLREVEGRLPYQLTVRNAAKLELWLSQRKIPLPAQRDDQLSHFRVL